MIAAHKHRDPMASVPRAIGTYLLGSAYLHVSHPVTQKKFPHWYRPPPPALRAPAGPGEPLFRTVPRPVARRDRPNLTISEPGSLFIPPSARSTRSQDGDDFLAELVFAGAAVAATAAADAIVLFHPSCCCAVVLQHSGAECHSEPGHEGK